MDHKIAPPSPNDQDGIDSTRREFYGHCVTCESHKIQGESKLEKEGTEVSSLNPTKKQEGVRYNDCHLNEEAPIYLTLRISKLLKAHEEVIFSMSPTKELSITSTHAAG